MALQDRTEARKDLAVFLRARRAEISPLDVGMSIGARRRTPGLRREELCHLAGVGLTWYTWLEQGRDINFSRGALNRLAGALKLNTSERNHLFALAQQPIFEVPAEQATVSPQLQRVLDVIGTPAYIIDRHWDILAWNQPTSDLFGDFANRNGQERNLVWLVFADPSYRHLFVNWEQDAQRVLAKFRVAYARGGGESDPANHRLVEELRSISPHFLQWWGRQDVLDLSEGDKRFRIKGEGDLLMHHTSFSIGSDPDLRLVVYS
ncbi:helix-turn-helix transcriptional regulator [Ottowia thiooxydans]|uniref:helix-turn-helix transcriptional regulator n=1 Tax=Ottowia thiooxydans TaxID=219182 RepID=UPI0003F81474|nr:helix-turn-helix transcriptional regulator [Ottowia thiooxydans]